MMRIQTMPVILYTAALPLLPTSVIAAITQPIAKPEPPNRDCACLP